MSHQRTRLQYLHWCTITETATTAQSAALKSHNLKKVVSSILTCRTFCHCNTGWRGKQEPTKSSTKESSTAVLFRNAASMYKAPINSLMHHNEMAQSAELKSHNLKKVVSLILTWPSSCYSNTGWREKQEPTENSTKDSLTTVLFRNAASTYKAPITSLVHHNGDSDNGAVGSALIS